MAILSDIESKYFDKPKHNLNITTSEESFSDLQRDEFINIAKEHNDNLSIVQYIVVENQSTLSLVFQYKNDFVGPNGNYNLSLNSKDSNSKVEQILCDKLSLKKYNIKDVLETENHMIVSPIFTAREFEKNSKKCFILMPFTESWSNRVWERLQEIIKKHNFICERADNLFGHDILEDIWKAINEAEVIIADTTTRNPNVFYEIGIAHTLGKKVILLTQKVTDIPFDFKRYRHIIYEDNVDGFKILEIEIPKYLK